MKLVYVTQYYPPHIGGLEVVAEKQAQSAVKNGHDATVITYSLNTKKAGEYTEDGVTVRRVRGLHFFDTYFGIPFCIPGIGLFTHMSREVKSADIVHIHDVFYISSWVAYFMATFLKKPVVLTQHVATVEHTNSLVMRIQKTVYGLFGKHIFNGSASIIVYNKIVKEFLVNKMKVDEEKILKIRNGIDVTSYSPIEKKEKALIREKLGLPKGKKLVLFVGRFVPKKGYRELYEARDGAYDIVFVGSGRVPHSWHNEKGIHILGEKSQDELKDIYKAVDMLVSPTKGEIFTLVMQEAFASGLPVISTDEKEYAEYDIDRENLVLCAPTSASIKTELQRIIDDEQVLQKMSVYSRNLAETMFDWEKNVKETFDLYEKVVAQRKKVLVTTSWDDGHVLDMRVAGLLEQYGVTGTFYISPKNHEFKEGDALSELQICTLARDFEVGAHTITHRSLTELSHDEVRAEVVDSKLYLETLLERPVTSFCYPRGKYSKAIVDEVGLAGFTFARTVKRFVTRRDMKTSLTSHTSIDTYDHWSDILNVLLFVRFHPVQFFKHYRKWDAIAKTMFDRVLENGGVFHLWGHSWQVEEHGDWNRLAGVLKHIANHKGVEYVENSKINLPR